MFFPGCDFQVFFSRWKKNLQVKKHLEEMDDKVPKRPGYKIEQWSVHPSWLGNIGDEILPTYIGIKNIWH